MTDSPKIKNISVRVKRTRRNTESLDEVRDQVSMKRCTVRLQKYNAEELRQLGKFFLLEFIPSKSTSNNF